MHRRVFTWGLGGAAAAFVACGGSDAPPLVGATRIAGGGSPTSTPSDAGGGSDSGTTSDAGTGGGADTGATGAGGTDAGGNSGTVGGLALTGTLSDSTSNAPLAGASVCLLGAPATCTSTDVSGAFTLSGLAASGSGFTASLTGYVTGNWPFTPTGNVSYSAVLRDTQKLATLGREVGTTDFGTTGAIYFEVENASGTELAGVTVTSSAGGHGGYFTADGSGLSSALSATTSAGTGYIFGVTGTVGLTFALAGATCVRSGQEGWVASTSGQTMTVPVLPGQLTAAHAICQ